MPAGRVSILRIISNTPSPLSCFLFFEASLRLYLGYIAMMIEAIYMGVGVMTSWGGGSVCLW